MAGVNASENLGPALIAVAWVFNVIAVIVVAARFYVRRNIIHRLSLDDWIILFTLALAFGDSIFVTIAVSWGLGQHVETLEALEQMNSIKWVFLCEIFAIMCPGFGRISYAILLLNIVTPTRPRRIFLWAIITVQFVVDVGTVIISMAQCQPIDRFWNHDIDGSCWDVHVQQYTGFFQGSVCSLVDLLLAIFPASLFWTLNMVRRQKIVLSAMMGLGIFAMIASIIKTVKLEAIGRTSDLTYGMAELAIWWTLEAYFVLICVSIPTLRPMFARKGATWDRSGQAQSGSAYDMWHKVSDRGKEEVTSHQAPLAVLSAELGENRAVGFRGAESHGANEYEMHGLSEFGRNRSFAVYSSCTTGHS